LPNGSGDICVPLMNGFTPAAVTVVVPPQFTNALDELVMQTGAGTREVWLKNVVKNILVEYQVRKHLGAQYQQQAMQVANLWP
jgi:hypothetical protein